MHFQLAPRSMTLDDHELLLSSNSLENFRVICQIWEATAAKPNEEMAIFNLYTGKYLVQS